MKCESLLQKLIMTFIIILTIVLVLLAWILLIKSDKARTNKVSIGLGLSIVRMIFMQQGENV
ncbi:MAG: hypothetical protein LLF98_14370 [Clostridium sp.]|uniref:hypothetical protein n=1 Tax=Clostridium sp. TaxID=1506 RepID=UPI0025BCC6E8|nr:hypothetical protein [Clostridium sp.]MCE5222384.1 hypothetical protein [Clostridium sp.]